MTTLDPALRPTPPDRSGTVLAVPAVALVAVAAVVRVPVAVAFGVLFVTFTLAERRWAIRPQPTFRPGWGTDVAHFFVNGLVNAIGRALTLGVVAVTIQRLAGPSLERLWSVTGAQPGPVRFVEALLVVAVSRYWSHRWTHRVGWLWRFHAVHHSSERLDWLAAARVHPVDAVFATLCTGVPLFVLGFDRATFGAWLAFTTISPFLDHANLRLRLPVLRWLIPNPEWHHWHHAEAAVDAAGSPSEMPAARNFSPFPFVDVVFGTSYLPDRRWPAAYGVSSAEAPPTGYLRQLAAPLRPRRRPPFPP